MMNLEKIESELIGLLSQDKKNWITIYQLMAQVEKERAYTTKSYTQWVNALAEKAGVHVSLLWARKKAGAAYEAYVRRSGEKGFEVPSMEKIDISPDNINLVTKIAGSNEDVADDLMTRVISNELHRSDLKQAWEKVKTERVARGLAPTRLTRHDVEAVDVANATDSISAQSILFTIQHTSDWITSIIDSHKTSEHYTYKVLDEFAVRPGTSRHARRIDAAVFEDLTNSVDRGSHGITVHGIEIKVSKSDLINDSKMDEYTNYCDFFWLAIPKELVDVANEYILDDWGILVFEKGKLNVYKKASKLPAIMREDALIEAIKRL